MIVQTTTGWDIREDGIRGDRIPDSIRQLVVLQSNGLSSETQRLLEAASIAGMEFSAAAIAAACETDTLSVERHCEQLAARQHFVRRVGVEEWPDGTLAARYSFLHALYQQLWHERVSPTQLQLYHLRIGERKERAYGEHAKEIAAELALHFEQGREFHKAIRYLEWSADHALQRNAYPEALFTLRRGLTHVSMLPDTTERAQQELRLQMMLTNPLIALKGFTDSDIELACTRARVLCEQTGDNRQLFSVLGGLFLLHFTRGAIHKALELAKQLLHFAEQAQEPHWLVWAHVRVGEVFGHTDYPAARVHLEHSIELYHASPARGFVQDPGVLALSRLAWVLLTLGYPDQALTRSQEALSLARQLSQPFNLIHAIINATGVHRWRGEEQAAQELDEELTVLSLEHGFTSWSTDGRIRQGVTLARQGQREDGLALIQQAIQELYVRGEGLSQTFALFRLAEVYGEIGQPHEGLRVLTEALAIAQRNGQIVWEATLYRLKGELLLSAEDGMRNDALKTSSVHHSAEAEACFLKSIEIARQQQAKSLELRATISLTHLWQQQTLRQGTKSNGQRGKSKGESASNGEQESRNTQHEAHAKLNEAHQLLSDIYNWFTEGFDTKDLREAKALLDELQDAKQKRSEGKTRLADNES